VQDGSIACPYRNPMSIQVCRSKAYRFVRAPALVSLKVTRLSQNLPPNKNFIAGPGPDALVSIALAQFKTNQEQLAEARKSRDLLNVENPICKVQKLDRRLSS
jgi:hypothetical protein